MGSDISHEEYRAIIEEIVTQSDRGAAITAAAFVDEILSRVIRSKFISLSSSKEKELFGGSGPLGTYEARTNIAYALGLLTDEMVADLKLIGRVRNKFAHRVHKIEFNDADITMLCCNFQSNRELGTGLVSPTDPRNRFISACMILIATFRIADIDRREEETKALAHLLVAPSGPK